MTILTDLKTTYPLVAATLSVPMFTSGFAALFWGPVCDAIGRRPTFLASALILVGVTIGCALSPNITGAHAAAAARGGRRREGGGKGGGRSEAAVFG
jgi:MFS family permease